MHPKPSNDDSIPSFSNFLFSILFHLYDYHTTFLSKHIALDFIFLYAIYIFKIKLTLYNQYQSIKYEEKLYDDTSCSSRRFIYACANM